MNLHIDEEPPEEDAPVGSLHTVVAKEFDYQSQAWLEDKGVKEAWIYNLDGQVRVMAWYS